MTRTMKKGQGPAKTKTPAEAGTKAGVNIDRLICGDRRDHYRNYILRAIVDYSDSADRFVISFAVVDRVLA